MRMLGDPQGGPGLLKAGATDPGLSRAPPLGRWAAEAGVWAARPQAARPSTRFPTAWFKHSCQAWGTTQFCEGARVHMHVCAVRTWVCVLGSRK